ncbi:uncharacterized protein LY89DRAFT_559650, partial [Mollisia scopiformis]
FLVFHDKDYFHHECKRLCREVQNWILHFSEYSDNRACRLTSDIDNAKIVVRLNNTMLDGSDVNTYLADRVKRRDVLMSLTMTMMWEFILRRYLFGMAREMRRKLQEIERALREAGPTAAVELWRATTLTLLSKSTSHIKSVDLEAQAVCVAIFEVLCEVLPSPTHQEDHLTNMLTNVVKRAVKLSIEMRTQRAEYTILSPLPDYNSDGDLSSKVVFNAASMNERDGITGTNEELERQKAIVRIILFPLVVKKGTDDGSGNEE